MKKLATLAWQGQKDAEVFVDLAEVAAIGRPWLSDNNDRAAYVRILYLRGGAEITVLDSDENWSKLISLTGFFELDDQPRERSDKKNA